ncbi:hypothetical protein AALP_AA6G217500 [Arabis alpina]|uniref:Uncharacterized protein n=1 Tax=Arabis alpina TaxID=50452 RepID=A0A087GQU7_ARAAL|nr:hypothetical protein AALP_AA6G217500 [Arabis alpina]
MTNTFKSLSTSFTPERNVSLDVNHEAPPVGFDPSPSLTEIKASMSRFAPVYTYTSEQTGLNAEASTPFVDTSDRTGGGSGEQYPNEQIDQEQVVQEHIVQEILTVQFDTYKISPSLLDERSLDSMRRVCRMSEELEFLVPRYCENKNICFSQMTMVGTCNLVALVVLDIWDSKYCAAEMRGDTPGIPTFNTPSIPSRPRKSRRLSEVSKTLEAEVTVNPSVIVVIRDSEDNTEGVSLPSQDETPAVKDGSQKIPYGTNAANMQRTDDASARGSVPSESNEPKDLGDVSLSKGKGKVDSVDKKAEKKRIAAKAKAKADLEAGRIPVAQSLGVTPPTSLLVSSDNAAIPPCPAVQTAVNVSQPPPIRAPPLTSLPRLASELSSEFSLSKKSRTTEVRRQRASGPVGNFADDYAAQVEALKEEKQKLEGEVKERDVHLEAASAEIAELRANLEKSLFTEDCLRKERDAARRRADEIASGSSARSARHTSRLEWIHLYLIALRAQGEVKAQLCYRRRARIILEKMVEAEYELPPGLLENYTKEEKEYLAKVESFDPLGDDTLFPTPPPPPAGLPRDVASQVPEGISEHWSFLSPQDNQDGDQV